MSTNDEQQDTSSITEQSAINFIEIASPFNEADIPPSLANHVDVGGGVDAITLTFYYVSSATKLRAVRGDGAENVEINGDRATIRLPPVARVAIPLSIAVDMLASIVEAAADGAPELQQDLEHAVLRVAKAVAPFGATIKREAQDG